MSKQGVLSPSDPVTAATIAMNVATIKQIPASDLPDPAARAALIRLAEVGVEVYAYESAGSHQTTIWLRPFSSDIDGRMTCAEWQQVYEQEVSEDALGELVPDLYDARKEYVRLASASCDRPNDASLRMQANSADQQLRELEQRIRLIRWWLVVKEHAAYPSPVTILN